MKIESVVMVVPKVLFLESFYGGSHEVFARGWRDASEFDIELVTLPARRYRLRARTAALEFSEMVDDLSPFDVVVVTDLLDLPDLRAAWRGPSVPPVLLYMHESQITYPGGSDATVDDHLRDVRNCLAADRVVFNSGYHRDGFLGAVGRLEKELRQDLPAQEPAPPGWTDRIEAKSTVAYPGVAIAQVGAGAPRGVGAVPRILWNHRFEWDKQPGVFLKALRQVAGQGVPFEVVLLGERPRGVAGQGRLIQELGKRVLPVSYIPERSRYLQEVARCDIVVSASVQENFGIAVVEAVAAGCVPLLPDRLSYPEIIPPELHPHVLYRDDSDLADSLTRQLASLEDLRRRCGGLPGQMGRFAWPAAAARLDAEIAALIP